MKRIKEQELKNIIKLFEYKDLQIYIKGVFKQICSLEKAQINFLNNNTKIQIKDEKNRFVFNLSYIEEIYFLQKNKLKFLTDKDIEILIQF